MKQEQQVRRHMKIYVDHDEVACVERRLTEKRIGFQVSFGRGATLIKPKVKLDAEYHLLVVLFGESMDVGKIALGAVSSRDKIRIYEIEEVIEGDYISVHIEPTGGSGCYGPGSTSFSFSRRLTAYGKYNSVGIWFSKESLIKLLKNEPRDAIEEHRFNIVHDAATGDISICLPHIETLSFNMPYYGYPWKIWTGVMGKELLERCSTIEDIEQIRVEKFNRIIDLNDRLASSTGSDKAAYLLVCDEDYWSSDPVCVYCPADEKIYPVRNYRSGNPVIQLADGTEKSMTEAGYSLVFPPVLMDSGDFTVSEYSLLAHPGLRFERMPAWKAEEKAMSLFAGNEKDVYLHALQTINLLRDPEVEPEGCFWPSHVELERKTRDFENMAKMGITSYVTLQTLAELDAKALHGYRMYTGRHKK